MRSAWSGVTSSADGRMVARPDGVGAVSGARSSVGLTKFPYFVLPADGALFHYIMVGMSDRASIGDEGSHEIGA
jgi:hypothetical protein